MQVGHTFTHREISRINSLLFQASELLKSSSSSSSSILSLPPQPSGSHLRHRRKLLSESLADVTTVYSVKEGVKKKRKKEKHCLWISVIPLLFDASRRIPTACVNHFPAAQREPLNCRPLDNARVNAPPLCVRRRLPPEHGHANFPAAKRWRRHGNGRREKRSAGELLLVCLFVCLLVHSQAAITRPLRGEERVVVVQGKRGVWMKSTHNARTHFFFLLCTSSARTPA